MGARLLKTTVLKTAVRYVPRPDGDLFRLALLSSSIGTTWSYETHEEGRGLLLAIVDDALR